MSVEVTTRGRGAEGGSLHTRIARPGWQDTAGAWLAEVEQRSGSQRTPEEYARYLRLFTEQVGDPASAGTAAVHAFAYAPGPSGREPSPSTVNVRLAALKSWYGFLRRMGLIASNPVDDVRRPHSTRPVPKGLDADELRRLLAAIPAKPSGQRDRAVIITAVLTGLRRSEVLGLHRGDLTRNGTVYYSVRAKGGDIRHRELPAPAFLAIIESLESQGRPIESLADDALIFDVTASTFAANLARYAKRAGLERITPHVLRHSAAKLRRDTGADLEAVQQLLGHRSLATTARYLARMEGQEDTGWQAAAEALGI